MRALRAFGRFWYDFIIGDDWKIAAAVVVALAALIGLVADHALGDAALAVLGAVFIVGCFAVSLAVDVGLLSRRSARRSEPAASDDTA